jgi:hypothetical protein
METLCKRRTQSGSVGFYIVGFSCVKLPEARCHLSKTGIFFTKKNFITDFFLKRLKLEEIFNKRKLFFPKNPTFFVKVRFFFGQKGNLDNTFQQKINIKIIKIKPIRFLSINKTRKICESEVTEDNFG